MITARGTRFVMFAVALLALALIGPMVSQRFLGDDGSYFSQAVPIALVALTLLFWFCFEWLLFASRVTFVLQELQVERVLQDERGKVDALWAGVPVNVRVRISVPDGLGLPYVVIRDQAPFACEQVAGQSEFEGRLTADEPIELRYRIRAVGAGRIRFEGVAVQLADLQGFFFRSTFLHLVKECAVLPALTDKGSKSATVKRRNWLLPPGVHRHRRPGSGTELLDLRDYRPGDPPKTIAWKVSARRDRLITKEYESEVPVRCTLFIDRSEATQQGANEIRSIGRLVEVAAAVTRSALEHRDLIGLCAFDERTYQFVQPGRGPRHLVRLLRMLSDMAGRPAAASAAATNELVSVAYAFSQDVYQESLRAEINRFPFWLAWLWPPPPYTVSRPRLADYLYRYLPFLLPIYALLAITFIAGATYALLFGLVESNAPAGTALVVLILGCIGMSLALFRLPGGIFFPDRRRKLMWRKRLCALFSVRHGLAPGGLAMLLEDDARFGEHLQRFLSEHHVPYPPSHAAQPRRDAWKIQKLAEALLRAVAKSHDNEFYVLFVEMLGLVDELAPLLRAVKVAIARHHRVIIICPWPVGVAQKHHDALTVQDSELGRVELLSTLTARRVQRAYRQLRHAFTRLGVPVVSTAAGDSARAVLDRLEMLRELGTKR